MTTRHANSYFVLFVTGNVLIKKDLQRKRRAMSACGLLIVEFHDGLQIIPAVWFNADKQSCIWPGHYKTKLRINKAIIKQETPHNELDWEEIPIKRVFAVAETYEKAIEKLVTAQDTSHVENNDISSDELRKRNKQKRRINARKNFSSSSSDEENKENHQTKHRKQLPSLPQIEDFVPNVPTQLHHTVMVNTMEKPSHQRTSANSANNVYRQCVASGSEITVEKTVIDVDEDIRVSNEFKKQVLFKLNKLLYKMDTMQTKINVLEEKVSHPLHINEELNIQLPIGSYDDLQLFEEQLQEQRFENYVLNILTLVGGSNPHVMIRNIMKKLITNTVAQQFSWAGKKAKNSFKNLKLANVIIRAVRIVYKQITDAEIVLSISKWLAQATVRVQRDKNNTAASEDIEEESTQ